MRRPAGWSNRRIVLLGLCAVLVLAVVGVLAGLAIGGGGNGTVAALPTTGSYVPLTVTHQQYRPGVDPDSLLKAGGNDLVTVLTRAGSHSYRLSITSTSTVGVINSLNWSPPAGMTISRVTRSTGGQCSLSGTPGFGGKQFSNVEANVQISCSGLNLKPPTCTCRGDGGEIVVSFVASTTGGLLSGATSISSATPTRRIIPGYVQTPDVPACSKGQVSTASSPCSTSS